MENFDDSMDDCLMCLNKNPYVKNRIKVQDCNFRKSIGQKWEILEITQKYNVTLI